MTKLNIISLSVVFLAVLTSFLVCGTAYAATPSEIGLTNSFGSGYADPVWLQNTGTSSWIVYAKGTCAELQFKKYNYSSTFVLSQKSDVVISGRYLVDDVLLGITVNGHSVSLPVGNYSTWTSFTMTIPAEETNVGANTIVFNLQDTGCWITGFRVEYTSVQIAPTYCANGNTMTSAEFASAATAGKITITDTDLSNQVIYHINNTTGCSAPIIAASYKVFIASPNPGWMTTQQFYADSGVVNINANGNTDITVSISSCRSQADLWYQTAPHSFTSDTGEGFAGYIPIHGGPTSSASLCTSCTPNTTKQCAGNAVYWYNSCGVQGTIYQQCNSNQFCQNAQCVTPTPTCDNRTFSNYEIYYDANSKTSPISCSLVPGAPSSATCDGGYYPDSATAQKLCQIKGYDTLVSWTNQSNFFTSCSDNFFFKWNGSTYSYVWACNANTGIDTVTCGKNYCPPICTPNTTKQCSSNAVYWYDSCGTKGSLYQQCTTNQICQNAQCVDQAITCSTNSQCGTNAYTGSPYCGTAGNVYQNYITYTCNNSGTSTSYCSNNTASQLKTTCTGNQTCSNGSCSNQTVTCSANTDCGTNSYTGSPYCGTAGNVYQNYITYTCNNSGTTTSYCSNNTASQLKTTCTGNQNCSNGTCGTSCTQNSYQQCQGNNLYWYDSCGNQLTSTYCPNGCSGNSCTDNNNVTVQTNSATNVSNNQATFNGYLYNSGSTYSCTTYVWFQYGPTSSYGMETLHQSQNSSGAFSQLAYNLNSGNTYHFRAAAQTCSGGIVYGQDMTTSSNIGTGTLTVSKTVRNLSSGAGFSSSTAASPSDMLMFMITLQANGGQDVQNIIVRDLLPASLTYNNQLVVACTTNNNNYSNCSGLNYNYTGNIASGVNLNTIYAGQTVTITYQTQVASATNFAFGSTTLNNSVSVTSSNGSNPSSSASVIVTRGAVLGASTVATGLTNNFWVDSFFLPLLIALLGIWLWKSGIFFGIEKWLDNKKKSRKVYNAEKELADRIAVIQKLERA